jgi:hypothetical protein
VQLELDQFSELIKQSSWYYEFLSYWFQEAETKLGRYNDEWKAKREELLGEIEALRAEWNRQRVS